MRAFFRNRWAVGGLLVGALAVWFLPADIPVPMGRRAASPSLANPAAGTVAVTNAVVSAQPSGRWRRWAREATAEASTAGLGRDPFSYQLPAPAAVVAVPSKAAPPPDLVLRGVSIHDGRAFAVVNRRVVKEGETVGEWRVARIETESVWVDGPAGQFVLRFRSPPEPRPPGELALEGISGSPRLPSDTSRTTE